MKKIFVVILLIGFLFSLSADEPQKPLKFSRTQTEWVSLAFMGGNYGLGGTFSFATLRWNHVYWEIARFQLNTTSKGSSFMGKTMVGFPLFLTQNNRHEIRLGVGLSGGMTAIEVYSDPNDTASVRTFYSMIQLPIEASYVLHISKEFAFQVGASLDIPVFFMGSASVICV